MKLTIKSIIRWEQLNGKPFSSLDYGNEDDIISLLYVCNLSEDAPVSLGEFIKTTPPDTTEQMVMEFSAHTAFLSQFQTKIEESKNEDSAGDNPVYIKDIVAMLVMNGLDAGFAFNEMEICDLHIFLQAYNEKMKQQYSSSRLWAFIQVSPHLPKRIKTPEDLLPFSWELEERKSQAAKQLEKDAPLFEAFMNSDQKPS